MNSNTEKATARLDNWRPKWEHLEHPNAGRPAANTGSPSVREIRATRGASVVWGEPMCSIRRGAMRTIRLPACHRVDS